MKSNLRLALVLAGLTIPAFTQQVLADTLTINPTSQTDSVAPPVTITLDDTSNPGKITVKVDVPPLSAKTLTGDINGVYFNLPSGINPGGLAIKGVAGGPVGTIDQDGSANNLGDGVNMNGGSGTSNFSVGVRIGNSGGIDGGDDYQSTTFTISGSNLTLSSFTSQSFGVRLKSVGVPPNRNGSSKTGATSPTVVTKTTPSGGGNTSNNPTGGGTGEDPTKPSEQVPEPTTVAGTLLAGAVLGWRRLKASKNS